MFVRFFLVVNIDACDDDDDVVADTNDDDRDGGGDGGDDGSGRGHYMNSIVFSTSFVSTSLLFTVSKHYPRMFSIMWILLSSALRGHCTIVFKTMPMPYHYM